MKVLVGRFEKTDFKILIKPILIRYSRSAELKNRNYIIGKQYSFPLKKKNCMYLRSKKLDLKILINSNKKSTYMILLEN